MVREAICIPAVSPFFCSLQLCEDQGGVFLSKDFCGNRCHATAQYGDRSNFTVRLLSFSSALAALGGNATSRPAPFYSVPFYSNPVYFLYVQMHNKLFLFGPRTVVSLFSRTGRGNFCLSVWFHTQAPFGFHIQRQLQPGLGYLAKH